MKEFYSLAELADQCEAFAKRLSRVPDGYGIDWFRVEHFGDRSLDNFIASVIDKFWHGTPVTLSPEKTIFLLLRLKFAMWWYDGVALRRPQTKYHRKEALVRLVSTVTDQWHGMSAVWLLTIVGEPGFLGHNVVKTMEENPSESFLYRWRSSYEDELTENDIFKQGPRP